MSQPSSSPPRQRIDWSQLWYPGPKRAFSADEMARAGSDAPSPTLLVMAAINFAGVAFVMLQLAPAGLTARLTAALVAVAVAGGAAARWLWWRPWRAPLMGVTYGLAGAQLLLAIGIRSEFPQRDERLAIGLVMGLTGAVVMVALWFMVVWRAQHIEARLGEQAERDKSIEMARRLATAQIEPHFLFNTLASVQHWVQTQDPRAATLLIALTGYLRATLPLFKHPLLAAGDELEAVQRYLQVMQARLNDGQHARLVWQIDVEPALQRAALPPGLLLTLVENAVVHGIEPRLQAGGQVQVRGRLLPAQGLEQRHPQAVFEVIDNGPGPPPAVVAGTADGLGLGSGLGNVRQRLALCGPQAQLRLRQAAGGGCHAEFELPFQQLKT